MSFHGGRYLHRYFPKNLISPFSFCAFQNMPNRFTIKIPPTTTKYIE